MLNKKRLVLGICIFFVVVLGGSYIYREKYNNEIESKIKSMDIKVNKSELLNSYNAFLDDAKKEVPKDSFQKFKDMIVNQEKEIESALDGFKSTKEILLKGTVKTDVTNISKQMEEYSVQLKELEEMLDIIGELPQSDIPGYYVLGQVVLNDKYNLNKNIQYTYNNKKVKIAFLTFDDGPTENTDDIVKILEENNIAGTFFLIGNRIDLYSDEFEVLLDSNSTIAMHSYTHQDKKIKKGDNLLKETQEYSKILKDNYGYTTNLLRVPTGSTLLNEKQREELREAGYYLIDWDVDSRDWEEEDDDKVYHNVVDNLRKNVEVILFHEKDMTIDVLQDVIDDLEREEYYILPMPSEYFVDYSFENISVF